MRDGDADCDAARLRETVADNVFVGVTAPTRDCVRVPVDKGVDATVDELLDVAELVALDDGEKPDVGVSELVAVELKVKPVLIVAVALAEDELVAELLADPSEVGEFELVEELVAVELKV